ncbi:MAG: AEC family transporter [Gammaproteobacteria bacterium]|nr:AEC family transporter [Gammaproteobacteria bacterium]
MSTFVIILQIVAPVFLLAAVGFIWVRKGYDYSVVFVTRLAMTISVPCLIFVALMNANIDSASLAVTFWAAVVSYTIVTAVFYVIVRLFRLDGSTYLHPLIFGNTGNLGLPLALFAFGEEGLSFAVIVFAVMVVYSFSLGIWMVSGRGAGSKVLKEPTVYGALLGALFLYNGWHTPVWLTNTLELAGQMAIPLMLITLGVALGRIDVRRFARPLVLTLVKVVSCTAVAVGVGLYFNLSHIALAVLILQLATPVAVTSYLLAEKYGADSQTVAGLVVVSTAISVIALPVLLVFLI